MAMSEEKKLKLAISLPSCNELGKTPKYTSKVSANESFDTAQLIHQYRFNIVRVVSRVAKISSAFFILQ